MCFLTSKVLLLQIWRKQVDFEFHLWQNSLYQVNFPTKGTEKMLVGRSTNAGGKKVNKQKLLEENWEQSMQTGL